MGDHPDAKLKCPNGGSFRVKSGGGILTAGTWPRKSESSKECVTTHLPNAPALKMDGAQALYLYFALVPNAKVPGVGERVGTTEGYPVKGTRGANSADLGSSSE